MSRPPLLMHLKVENERSDFGIWLPLFLILPVALVVFIILSPFIIIALMFSPDWGWWSLKVIWAAVTSYWAMRGLEVEVQDSRQHLVVSVV
jgi:hypothetical protein